MTKGQVEKFIHKRKRTFASLLREFGYQPKMSGYLKQLLKEGRISSHQENMERGGMQMIFSRMKY